MKLYHGSLEVVKAPRIIPTGHTAAYGNGFYTTTSFNQAEKWVKRKLNEEHKIGYVNHSIPMLEALREFYQSDTYKNLEQEYTKFWHYGPVALYQEFTKDDSLG
ncbi:MAG: DUF3990 domain-containing protein [Bacteroidaceae bacterium]|nr:DUF3990 domain-containing protein [Bacteroidaceae bacterium]MBO6255771.1 DUF3990 domain-containing protein [Bacteroidaceae bacterium]